MKNKQLKETIGMDLSGYLLSTLQLVINCMYGTGVFSVTQCSTGWIQ
jgi:hypothetical protein